MSATLAELESRVIALEADRIDYGAVLSTVNALSTQTRERLDLVDIRLGSLENRLMSVENRLTSLENRLTDTNQRVRSIEDSIAELKDLLIRALAK